MRIKKTLISLLMSTLLTSFNALTVNADDEYTDSMLSFGKDSLESASYSVSNTKEYWWNSELEVATMGSACGYRLTLFYVPDTLSAEFEDSDNQHGESSSDMQPKDIVVENAELY